MRRPGSAKRGAGAAAPKGPASSSCSINSTLQAAGIKTQIEEERRAAYAEDDGDEKDGNPFGFLVLYGVSAVPIFITIAALSIMFVNSLQ